MKLESQLVNLELSQEIDKLEKKLGVEQESVWKWRYRKGANPEWDLAYYGNVLAIELKISAYTTDELGEKLPALLGKHELKTKKTLKGNYFVYYEEERNEDIKRIEFEKNEANSRAAMYKYLPENDLIKHE